MIKILRYAYAVTILAGSSLVARIVGGKYASPFMLLPRSPLGPNAGDGVPADPHADPCGRAEVGVAQWPTVNVRSNSTRFKSLSLRLPVEYDQREYHEVFDGTGQHWGHIVASWHRSISPTRGRQDTGCELTFWIDPVPGYPTVGVPPGTKQLWYRECRRDEGGQAMHQATFAVRHARQHETYFAAAFWPIADGAWLRALGSGPTRTSQIELEAILQAVSISKLGDQADSPP